MAFHCSNCNGSMVFDPASQLMRCAHCGSEFDPQGVDVADQAVVSTTITCQNCGAELEGTDDSLVGFCPYCGGQSLVSRPGGGFTAESVIPFQVSKERCIEAYSEYTKGISCLHKDFKDPEHIKKFTGIYMPYYQYDATIDVPKVEGQESHRRGNTTTITTYSINVELEGDYEHGAPFDASKYLDDEISARCMPFNVERQTPFRPAYLAGFYADASTTHAELYTEDAQAQAEEDVLSEIDERVQEEYHFPTTKNSHAPATVTSHHTTLFPLWFLTWRKDDRVAYAVVNGESGQVVSDLPLNLQTFFVKCALFAAALFAVFEFAFYPTPGMTAFVGFIAAALMLWGIHASTKRVYQQQTHANDKGWSKSEGVKFKPISGRKRKHNLGVFIGVLIPLVTLLLMFISNNRGQSLVDVDRLFDARGSMVMKVAPVVVLVVALFVLVNVLMWHKEMKEWNAPIAIGALVVAVLVNAAIIFIAPVDDLWYYLGDFACILGLIASSVAMLRVYNLSTTRPLPKLFDREEV